MDNPRLRELLEVYRPGVDDQDDQFTEFVALLRHDPALQQQLEARLARDRAIRDKLRAVAPPADLKARLLAARKTIAFPWDFSQQPLWLRIAAAIVLLGFAIIWLKVTRQDAFLAYRTEMAQFVATDYLLDVHADNLDALRQVFAAKGWPADFVVPQELTKLRVEGGCLREWRGRRVSLLCLETDHDGDVWLFVAGRPVTPDAPDTDVPLIQQIGRLSTAGWSAGNHTYLLVTESRTVPIYRYLPEPTSIIDAP